MLDAIRQRNQRRKDLESSLADGKRWYFHNPDDDLCMNILLVSTNPVEPDYTEVVQHPDDPSDGDIVAVTLLQSPRIRFSRDQNPYALAQLIAEEHNQPASADIDLLLAHITKAKPYRSWMIELLARAGLALIAGFGFVAAGIWLGVPLWMTGLCAIMVQVIFWELMKLYD